MATFYTFYVVEEDPKTGYKYVISRVTRESTHNTVEMKALQRVYMKAFKPKPGEFFTPRADPRLGKMIAEDIADGWKRKGPYPDRKYYVLDEAPDYYDAKAASSPSIL